MQSCNSTRDFEGPLEALEKVRYHGVRCGRAMWRNDGKDLGEGSGDQQKRNIHCKYGHGQRSRAGVIPLNVVMQSLRFLQTLEI